MQEKEATLCVNRLTLTSPALPARGFPAYCIVWASFTLPTSPSSGVSAPSPPSPDPAGPSRGCPRVKRGLAGRGRAANSLKDQKGRLLQEALHPEAPQLWHRHGWWLCLALFHGTEKPACSETSGPQRVLPGYLRGGFIPGVCPLFCSGFSTPSVWSVWSESDFPGSPRGNEGKPQGEAENWRFNDL